MMIGKGVRITLWSVAAVIMAAVIAMCALTLYLTPSRLSGIISREMSDYFNADVRIENARFTFWSTFPRFTLQTDSVVVVSHSLDGLPADRLAALPSDARLLASASSLGGGINIIQAFRGRYVMRDIEVSDLRVNLVTVNDSVNNYDILPKQPDDDAKVPFFTTDILTLRHPRGITAYFANSDTKADIELDSVVMKRLATDTDYSLAIDGRISARASTLHLFDRFPFTLGGEMALDFKPFGLKFSNLKISTESITSELNMNVGLVGEMSIDSLDYHISVSNITNLFRKLPWLPLGNLEALSTDLTVNITARLDRPYSLRSGELPWITLNFNVPAGRLDYRASDGRMIPLDYSAVNAGLSFNGSNPAESTLYLQPTTLAGDATRLTLSGHMTRLLESPLLTLDVQGNSSLSGMAQRFPELKDLHPRGTLTFSGRAKAELPALSAEGLNAGLRNISYSGDADISNLNFDIDGYLCHAGNIRLIAASSSTQSLASLPLRLTATADKALVKSPQNGPSYASGKLSATLSLDIAKGFGSLSPINLTAQHLSIDFGKENILQLDAASAHLAIAGPHSHSATAIALSSGKGTFTTGEAAIPFSNLQAFYTPDSISLGNLDIQYLSSSAGMKGSLVNLDSYIQSGLKEPLKARFSIECDTIQVNQLAHTFYRGGAQPTIRQARGNDTISVIIPSNLDIALDFHADESVYTNLHLHDLGGRVRVKDGIADLDSLSISADFGHALFNASYDTSDRHDLRAAVDGEFNDIDIVEFFRNFHALLLMMPQASNLEGILSVHFDSKMHIFPDMYLCMPSLQADIAIQGRELSVHQSKFIHRLARKLLIRDNGDLEIADMNISAHIRDNLVELYPFVFELDKYKLRVLGTNNFAGDLYYHIDVMNSPLPFRFGINVEGDFDDPKIRFGKASFDSRRGEEITMNNEEASDVNIVEEARYYIREFVRKAAQSEELALTKN